MLIPALPNLKIIKEIKASKISKEFREGARLIKASAFLKRIYRKLKNINDDLIIL